MVTVVLCSQTNLHASRLFVFQLLVPAVMSTAKHAHFSSKWSITINESTARKLYLEKLKEASKSKSGDKNLPRVYTCIKKVT